jgi:hypothetical protein
MSSSNVLQLRELALALLQIEREQWMEQWSPESDQKIGPSKIQRRTSGSGTRRSSGADSLILIRRAAC